MAQLLLRPRGIVEGILPWLLFKSKTKFILFQIRCSAVGIKRDRGSQSILRFVF